MPQLRDKAPFWCRHKNTSGAFDCLTVPLTEEEGELCRAHEVERVAVEEKFFNTAISPVVEQTQEQIAAAERRSHWPFWPVLLLALPMITGCGGGAKTLRVMEYEDCPDSFTIKIETAQQIALSCRSNGISDEGQNMGMASGICCMDGNTNTIHAGVDAAFCITHELAHLCGVKTPEKLGYNWPGHEHEAQFRQGEIAARVARFR